MKVKKLKDGDQIEVDDRVCLENFMGKRWFRITRVTPKFVFLKWNDHCEGKFPRVFKDFGWKPGGSKDIWNTTHYSAWRPVIGEIIKDIILHVEDTSVSGT